MNHRIVLAGLLIIAASTVIVRGQTPSPGITKEELKEHVKFLSSDELEGRGSGTEGNAKAAAYIADEFKKYGLLPGGQGTTYLQEFEFVSAVATGKNNHLTLRVGGMESRLKPDEDFRPLGFSADGTVTGPLVFAGYGMTVPVKDYDDYKDLDVTGKIVVVLRYSPDGTDPHSEFSRHSALRSKARAARDKGAAGIILVTGEADQSDDALISLTYDNAFASSGIPAISLRRSAFDDVLRHSGRSLRAIQDSINDTKKPVTFEIQSANVELAAEVEKVMARTSNVVGYVEGSMRDEVVVIGAHMDHVGFGGEGSGSLVPDTREIHNGADDNASGTAALLELAQAISAGQPRLRRTTVFIAFSGEEIGLLGSAHYVNHPLFPIANTIAMLNMDMIGRLRDNALTIHGTGSSPFWPDFIKKHNPGTAGDESFTIQSIADGFGPSDHAQFYGKDVPVLFFFTGSHNDYHKPSDDWEKLNYEGHERITRMVHGMARDLSTIEQRPAFVRTPSSGPMAGGGGDSRGFAVTLGVVPDYGETSNGMKIGGLRPNGPAEKAGLKPGDIIVRMGGKKVLNIYDYMGMLSELKAGDEVQVAVLRNGSELTFKAVMEKRQ